ncbi:MAG: ABC transporter substrate binding protein [Woeseiaceae bacterium]|nr:ABC transporter substrate binding protein [Woeseiaceae bacterium]MDX2606956.1 ABC transporter substrate binding protein [Woeseiaceae bacterium]
MWGRDAPLQQAASVAIILAAVVISGCSTVPPAVVPVEAPTDIVIVPPVPPVPTEQAKPPIRPPIPPRLPSVAIVLTSGQPAYADVARELTLRLKDYDVYDLSAGSQPPVSVLRAINDSDPGAVVAIGLRAARSAVAMSRKPVLFSQVFNYQDHDLLTENSRGVSSLAPLEAQLVAWKEIDPTITRIGIIIGEGHEDLIAEVRQAAERHDVTLNIRIAHSDQETLYLFKRMIRDIDGYWLFPDNRILSTRILKQMFDEAKSRHIPVIVPNESMLKMGAAISISTVASDIADTIVKVIRRIQAGDLQRVPPLTALSEIRVQTNEAYIKQRSAAHSQTRDLDRVVSQ